MAKILVVDDDAEILALIRNALKKEYEVSTVQMPKQELAGELNIFDLIILDVMMPGTDGYTLCSSIRDKVDCPIIFLTAKALEDDVVYGLSVGADDYLKKPFSLSELRARVAAHLRREKREHVQVFERNGIRFYLQDRHVMYNEQTIPFTKSEYDIALFLAKNKGQIFSKEQIYEQIYGFDKAGNDSAITEHVKNIRRKLSEHSLDLIETVWGIGYKWKG